ncbi:hypothetical protein GCM10023340_26090 [Nocardioides marinquilinus]|uniref:Uncharacterized protein n=1 Tax=Nocardioides marinquilinus TaxID=1210400 RepID=A0ABP9PPD2_9ACTN
MKKILVVVSAVLVALVGSIAPSSAEAVEKTDPRGDAPARMDIARVTYRNMPQKAAAHIVVPELVRGGSAQLVIAPPDSDVFYIAYVRVAPNGTLRKRLTYATQVSERPQSCVFKAVWDAGANYIDVSVPRNCLKGMPPSLYMQAITGMGKDAAPPAYHLLQG